ncbi:hypothetical protein CH63R_01894 [Colletotrichum higginsianum IMI 349063]|uniref:Uncharacterized protein n=1 Tax=Colletotrichum higginsianum (strain IMI 349063) TaxID=759273 RepID=A0A1B7YMN5_COLHI|nr:hypothetical protein CH63R_01894 [Colletotrichum higginsianum IMI 349063]OBR13168.1 hypothetical protein CH63R_01894 [Colletotrichum higginsianum IMI 349063]GJC96163.1 hypothetical protein ColKHC_04989 [Colletotrichum higginsianum]
MSSQALAAWVERSEFGAAAGVTIDSREYLRRLMEEYDIKIIKSDLVLQGASLAFKMVHGGPQPALYGHYLWS